MRRPFSSYEKSSSSNSSSSSSSSSSSRLKATNERQDYGAGILRQVAQLPIDQVYLIYKAPMLLSTHTRP